MRVKVPFCGTFIMEMGEEHVSGRFMRCENSTEDDGITGAVK